MSEVKKYLCQAKLCIKYFCYYNNKIIVVSIFSHSGYLEFCGFNRLELDKGNRFSRPGCWIFFNQVTLNFCYIYDILHKLCHIVILDYQLFILHNELSDRKICKLKLVLFLAVKSSLPNKICLTHCVSPVYKHISMCN